MLPLYLVKHNALFCTNYIIASFSGKLVTYLSSISAHFQRLNSLNSHQLSAKYDQPVHIERLLGDLDDILHFTSSFTSLWTVQQRDRQRCLTEACSCLYSLCQTRSNAFAMARGTIERINCRPVWDVCRHHSNATFSHYSSFLALINGTRTISYWSSS